MPVAVALADWAVQFTPSEIDLALADRALSDTVAVGLAARDHPLTRVAAVLGEAGRWAATCHVLDFDDLHMPSTTHISTVCVPVALAVPGVDPGRRRLAYLAGAGVMARVGTSLGWRHYANGWHATTTAGALGAATVAAVATGLDVDGVARAIALAVPAAGGVQRAFGTDAKSLQVGFAADAGVRAAALAAAGAGADLTAVEAWLSLVSADRHPVDLSGDAVPDGLAIKIYPACYALQRPIAAVKSALQELGELRIEAAAVDRVSVRTPAATVQPLIHHRPSTGLQGKFSLEYAMATAMLDEHSGFAAFTDPAVCRPDAQRLIERVDISLDPGGTGLLAGQVEVDIKLADGIVLHAALGDPPGSPSRPPTAGELGAKFTDCLLSTGLSGEDIRWDTAPDMLRASVIDALIT